ncbi:hypothetical protein [Corynebacterium sp. CCM 9203]
MPFDSPHSRISKGLDPISLFVDVLAKPQLRLSYTDIASQVTTQLR